MKILFFAFVQNAYTATAINSTNFCTSAKDAFVILVENALRVAAINTVGDFMLFLGKVRPNMLSDTHSEVLHVCRYVCTFAYIFFAYIYIFFSFEKCLAYQKTISNICNIKEGLTKPLICISHCSKYFRNVWCSFNPNNKFVKEVLLLSSFYRWRNWGTAVQ